MQQLIKQQRETESALRKINSAMEEPLGRPEQGDTSQEGNSKAMNSSMRDQPIRPGQRLVTTWTFFNGHLGALQWKVAKEMPHHQKQE